MHLRFLVNYMKKNSVNNQSLHSYFKYSLRTEICSKLLKSLNCNEEKNALTLVLMSKLLYLVEAEILSTNFLKLINDRLYWLF